MNIIVISDKENAERRENVCNEFGKYNLEFSFFDAIMANKMSKEDIVLTIGAGDVVKVADIILTK